MTRTNHPIQFKAYSDQPLTTVPTSMKILSNTTRDIEIYTPLNIKSSLTVIDNNILINGNLTCSSIIPTGTGGILLKKLDGSNAIKILDTGASQFYENVIADKNLTVFGTSSFNSDVTISATRNSGTSVESRITNLGDGYASFF